MPLEHKRHGVTAAEDKVWGTGLPREPSGHSAVEGSTLLDVIESARPENTKLQLSSRGNGTCKKVDTLAESASSVSRNLKSHH